MMEMRRLATWLVLPGIAAALTLWGGAPVHADDEPPELPGWVGALVNAIQDLQSEMERTQAVVIEQDARIAGLESTVADLQAQLAAMSSNTVLELDGFVSLTEREGLPLIVFTGVNVGIVNGAGSTETVNGLGNLIVGYDRPNSQPGSDSIKTGSHNIIGGDQNSYASYGGLLVGWRNAVTAPYAAVIGGNHNTAAARGAAIVAGGGNVASGGDSGVLGGHGNEASGTWTTVAGGLFNTASGWTASVAGGVENIATSSGSTVAGGKLNTAMGLFAAVSGGLFGVAEGEYAAVAGGWGNTARGDLSVIAGGHGNTAIGRASAVGGGRERFVTGEDDWKAGGLFEDF